MKRALFACLVSLLASSAAAQPGIPPSSLMPPVVVFAASAVNGAGVVTGNSLFASGSNLGVGINGSTGTWTFRSTGGLYGASATYPLGWDSSTLLLPPADGNLQIVNAAITIGSRLKVDALPAAGTCGTSPAVTAGSTPLAGSVNVGTGGTATSCTVTFGGTAFPSAPFCIATPTTTNAVTRASASTTVLTLSSTTAWTASDVIQWVCISAK